MATEAPDDDQQAVEIPEDFREFQKFRDSGELPAPKETREAEQPAAGEEETPSSESAEEAGQTAEESDTPEAEAEQAEQAEPPQDGEKSNRLSRRMRKLTGTIAELQARLDQLQSEPEAEEEVTEEAASSTETEAEGADKLRRPMLKDFEDTDEASAWDQYEAAMEAYNDAKTAKIVADSLAKQRKELDEAHAKATAQAEWNKAAARFPDYNEVVREEVKISAAMESVMRMDPETGTELAYYLGQHPEESERIAKATLANNEREWTIALARAGMELGTIRAAMKAGKAPAATAPKAHTPKTPATPPQPKKVTSASKPPTQIRGGTAAPAVDVLSDEDAADYRKWNKAREAQLRRK